MTTDGRVTSGTVLAGYRVISLAGRGGMGKVYRARDERLGRDVALKVLFGKAADDPALRVRLVRESRLAASLDHPNVVPVYDAGDADGHVFIAMRFVDGTDLEPSCARVRCRWSALWPWPRRSQRHWTPATSKAWYTATSNPPTCWWINAGTAT